MANKTAKTAEPVKRRPMQRFFSDPNYGLTRDQVNLYRSRGWDNRSVTAEYKSTKDIIKSNTLTYFNLIFFIFAILLILVGSFRDLTFMIVIVANTLIGIIQEINARKAIEKLSMLNAPRTQVLRDGKVKTVPSERLVLDDIVIFSSGNQISADAIVVEGEVSVNESLLTGEADEIIKHPGDPLLSGSFVVSGSCKARLERVGEDSYISKLTLEAKASKKGEQSHMVRSLNRLVGTIGIIIIPIGIILFVQQYIYAGTPLKESVQAMVAAVIGMVPEGIFLLTSITLFAGVVKLGAKKVLVHDMKCIETLARVNVLCVDKTGTITDNSMKVSEMIPMPGYDAENMPSLDALVSDFAQAMTKDNITMQALQEYFNRPLGMKAERITSFSPVHKYSGAVFAGKAYVVGAPDFVLRSDYPKYVSQIEEYSSKGMRVLVFGMYEGMLDGNALIAPVTPLCLIALTNPVRPEAKSTFKYFEQQGVEIKVISGDNPLTVSEVAKEAGITNADRYIDASTLKTYADVYRAVDDYTVFGRVGPNQKRDFVKALKARGRTVAMTGDGVNDVLALKDADCSIAMASGSDAAAQASQLVLLESDFSRMPEVVSEGRQIVNNLERSGSLFLVKNIFSLITALVAIGFATSFPIQPSQLTLISLITIGLPGLFLSQAPNEKLIEGKFVTNIILKAIPAGVTDAIVVSALVLFGITFNVGSVDISTAATILLTIVGFMILYQICKPFDAYKRLVWFGCAGAMVFVLIFMRNLFAISGMSARCILLFVLFSVVTEPLFRYLTKLTQFIRAKISDYVTSRTIAVKNPFSSLFKNKDR